MFSQASVRSHFGGGGYPHPAKGVLPSFLMGSTPILPAGGTPSQVRMASTPIPGQDRTGLPHSRSGWGVTPILGQNGGANTLPHQDWMGVPPIRAEWVHPSPNSGLDGVPPCSGLDGGIPLSGDRPA